jgi:basic membrane lipoprotein Med (substrate-binding protein (PBP1-ABC) superfamily)
LDHQGFIAGFIAAMITTDWRVGVIGLSDSTETIAARQAFFTGVKYYCGLCRPSYPPWYEYPLFFELEAGADTISWRTAADYMIQRYIGTVYVVPGAGDEAMFLHLAEEGINIISGMPPQPNIEENWVASLEFNLMETFKETWPAFASGEADTAITIPLRVGYINPELFSPGKQRLANQVLADVLAGFIDLGVTPITNP